MYKRLLCKICISLLSTVTDWTCLSTFKQIQQAFEYVSALKKHFNRIVKENTITQILGSNQNCSKVAKLQLYWEVK